MTKKRTAAADAFAVEEGPQMRSGRAPLHKFQPYPQNARTHPPAEIALLAHILRTRGADQSIVVDEDWIILKGHGRLEAAYVAKMDDFPYVQRLGLSEADKTAIRIEDNAVPLLAGWDRELVAGEIASLKTAGYDLSLLGFGDAQLVQFTTTPGPPGQFPAVGENIETEFCCPNCNFAWSGAAKPKGIRDDSMRVRVPEKTGANRRSRATAKVSSRAPHARKKKARPRKAVRRKQPVGRAGDGATPEE